VRRGRLVRPGRLIDPRRLIHRQHVKHRGCRIDRALIRPGRLVPVRSLRCRGCLIRGGRLVIRLRRIDRRRHMSLAHRKATLRWRAWLRRVARLDPIGRLRRVTRLGPIPRLRIGRSRLIRPVDADRGEGPGDRGWPRLRKRPGRHWDTGRNGLRRRRHPRRCGHHPGCGHPRRRGHPGRGGHPRGRERRRMRHHHGLGNHSWLRKRRRRRLPRQLLPSRWPIVHRSANGYLPYRSGCWQLGGPGERGRDNRKKSVRDAVLWLPLTALTSIPSISGTNRM
jgi:hypothetical protein